MAVSAGSRLVIPCRFNTRPNKNNVEMEWGMVPDNGGEYRALLNLNDGAVIHRDPRTAVIRRLVRSGSCSLTVSPITTEDSGFYEINLRVDGHVYEPAPIVHVSVSETSGVDVTSISLVPEEMAVSAGSRLVIPCRFPVRPNQNNVEMEWGMVPENGGEYRALLNLNDGAVTHHDPRTAVMRRLVRSGSCSLAVSPITTEDSGFYKIHLRVDGHNYEPAPSVYVRVSETTEASPVTAGPEEVKQKRKLSKVTTPGSRATTPVKRKSTIENFLQELFKLPTDKWKAAQKIYRITAFFLSLVLLIINIGVGIYLYKTAKYYKKDNFVLLEEGLSRKSSSTSSSEGDISPLPPAFPEYTAIRHSPVPRATPKPATASVIPKQSDTTVPSGGSSASSSEASDDTATSTPSVTSATSVLSVSREEDHLASTTSMPSEGPAAPPAAVTPVRVPTGCSAAIIPAGLSGRSYPVVVFLHKLPCREGRRDRCTCTPIQVVYPATSSSPS
ncbi:uncharacterized protein [Hyperolius riggenbachi]|uniref:uncharacterized protein n=1 Tax=Hyperolius riggenbachi TaxID=752182 RepID=UPI0035A317BE